MRLKNADNLLRTVRVFLPLLLGGAVFLTFAQMSARAQDSLATRAWGSASMGQIGDGGDETRRLPVSVAVPGIVRAVAAGWRHNLALGADGTVWAWGSNDQCQAGKKDALYLTLPLPVAGIAGVQAIAAGGGHSLALKSDGTVWAWGNNTFGQLGRGVATTRFDSRRPMPLGGPDGRPEPAPVKNLAGVVAVAAGSVHSLALKADGTVWAWGRNVWGELGTGTRHLARPVPASRSASTSILTALRRGEESGDCSLPLLVEGVDQAAAIAAGPDTSYAIRKDGTLWNWGVISRKPSAQGSYTYSAAPMQFKALRHVIAVAPGATHTLALTADGTVWAWGSNNWGELGDGTLHEHESPAPVEGLGSVTAIAAGNGYSAALQSDGRVWTWGHNAEGELGDGAQNNRQTPTAVKDVVQAVAISAGECHCLALTRSTPNQNSAPAALSPDPRSGAGAGRAITAALAGADGTVAYKSYYEVDPFHWSRRAVSELRINNVIPSYPDRYENLIRRRQFALNIQRGLDYSVFGRPGPNGSHFPADDPQSLGRLRRGARPTLWPQEARLLLRLLREYRADLNALYSQANRAAGELDEAEQRLNMPARETAPLDTPVIGLKMTNASVEDVYTQLVQTYHVPLSLIETQANPRVSISVQAGTARDALDQIRAQATAYRLRTVHGRLILMPSASRFDTVLDTTAAHPTFTNVPRIDATQRYCNYVSRNIPRLSGLSAPLIIMGNPNTPLLTEPVTLRGKATVLEHFVQLLGKNPQTCFYIHRHLTFTDTLSLFYINKVPDVLN